MKILVPIIIFIFLMGCSNQDPDHKRKVKDIEKQLEVLLENCNTVKSNNFVSPRTYSDGDLKLVPSGDWTSGFFSGELWMMYDLTGNDFWKENALEFTLPLEQEKFNSKTHDMGFKMFCSYGKAYSATKNPEFREILIQSAKTLAMRFNENVGCIRSWDHNTDKWDFPVIIDNMMNLELLLWAAKETGNKLYKDIAISHAETTLKNHFRDDNSSYHVIDYNPETGEIQNKHTYQGYAHESAWSRGQAWGLYGFTMVYRETLDPKFLDQAEKIADYIINHPNLPDNNIPFWDFNAPEIPNEPYDASAAAIIASALYELSNYIPKSRYLKTADKILSTLSSPEFLAEPGSNYGFLLKHSTGSKPGNSEIDTSIIYADYYFMEALLRKINYL